MTSCLRLSFRSLLAAILLVGLSAATLPLAAQPAAPAGAQQPYHILHTWKLTDPGWWDYLHVDSAAHRVYITRGDHVDVLDTRTGKQIGSIGGLHGTHGVAFDTAGKYGWVSDGGGNAVVEFDRRTLATLATIPAGGNPDGIIFEPATQTVWAFNGRSHSVTVISAAQRKVVATIALPGKPEFPQVDGHGTVFDNIEDKSEIVRLNARTLKLTATWPAGCDSPSGLAFDVPGHRLFPVCRGNKMSVLDSRTGKLLANPSIGKGPDAVRWSAKHKLILVSCGEGVLSVIDASKPNYPTIETLSTMRGARTLAYDPATDRIYLVTAQFGPRPAPTPQNPHGRPAMIPGSFTVLVAGR
ncbi:MAG TPA: YncE family protein [Terracidiphilus sp.]|nr:YncE family protein [Terracidiphilus sp.]